MAKKINYKEGDWFLVPLRSGGFARGVVARMNRKGAVFGYFFGPKLTSSDQADARGLCARNAILMGDCGDLGLLNKEWSIAGNIPGWKRDDWPMPPLIRVDEVANKAWLSQYDEETFELISEKEVDPSLVSQYPYDRTMGYGAVEIRLTKLLSGQANG